MTKRLKLMLAVLAAIAALMVLDRPDGVAVVEVSEEVPRLPRKAVQEPLPMAAPVAVDDEPIPDLFAHPAAPQPTATAAEESAAPQAAQRPARPFTLVGFRQDDTAREAYLLRARDGNVATVRVGDIVDRRYRVLALRADAVDIKDNASGASFRIGFEDHQ